MVPVAEAIAAEGVEVWVIGDVTGLSMVPDELFVPLDLPVRTS
jgi:hypothetical protein